MKQLTDFFNAVKLGDADRVASFLVEDPTLIAAKDEGATALHYAALNNQRGVVDVLLSNGSDIDAEDDQFLATPIGWANEKGNDDMVRYLHAQGAHITFHRAAAFGFVDELREMLLMDEPDVNAMGGYGTPLHEAALWGHPEAVSLLLENGADPAVLNVDGKTARDVAQHQIDSGGEDTPLVPSDRRAKLIAGCREVARILERFEAGN